MPACWYPVLVSAQLSNRVWQFCPRQVVLRVGHAAAMGIMCLKVTGNASHARGSERKRLSGTTVGRGGYADAYMWRAMIQCHGRHSTSVTGASHRDPPTALGLVKPSSGRFGSCRLRTQVGSGGMGEPRLRLRTALPACQLHVLQRGLETSSRHGRRARALDRASPISHASPTPLRRLTHGSSL